MTSHILVTPPDLAPFDDLEGLCFVPRVRVVAEVSRVADAVRRRNLLHCVLLEDAGTLADLAMGGDGAWADIPLCIHVPRPGPLGSLLRSLERLVRPDLRVLFTDPCPQSVLAVRQLASLGVSCGLVLPDRDDLPWPALSDLVAYGAYGLVPRAAIEPLEHVARHYRPGEMLDLDALYFDSPERFLHLLPDGRLALTRAAAAAGDAFLAGVDALDEAEGHVEMLRHRARRRDALLRYGGCACCPAWLACGGRFGREATRETPRCQGFFAELIDAAEHLQRLRNQVKTPWPT